MKAGFWILPWLLCPILLSAGLPGEPVAGAVPELREPVRQMQAAIGPGGEIYLQGDFPTVDGSETGGIVRLGPDGGVEEVLAERLVPLPWPRAGVFFSLDIQFPPSFPNILFPLEDGRLLLSQGGDGWAMTDTVGDLKPGFFGDVPPEIRHLSPQFERNGHLYCVVVESDGKRYLARQPVASEVWEPVIVPSDDWPFPPTAVIPEADGRVRVLGAVTSFPAISFGPMWQHDQRVFLVEPDGAVVSDVPMVDPGLYRQANLSQGRDGLHKLTLGPDSTWFGYWPSPTSVVHRVEWRNADSELARVMDFPIPRLIGDGGRFVIGEEPDGAVVATGPDGSLQRWFSDGTVDESFTSPGPAQTLLALPDGKWLLNGTRRILADGHDDPSWSRPDLERPAKVTHLARTPDGGWLTAGNFHRANGESANRLVKWNSDGTPADGFWADPRLTEIRLLEAMPDGGVLIVTGFTPVTLDDGRSSHLVRLLPSGELDEDFFPPLPEPPLEGEPTLVLPTPSIERIAVQPDGRFLILSMTESYNVRSRSFGRRLADGTGDASFQSPPSAQRILPSDLLVLEDGSFFLRGGLHGPDGEFIMSVDGSSEGWGFRALCQTEEGAVILSTGQGNRLHRWKDGAWDEGFAGAVHGATWAAPAGGEKLLLWGSNLRGDVSPGAQLVRLHPNGRVDPTFRAPKIERHPRRGGGPWETITAEGFQPVDPSDLGERGSLSAVGWDEMTGRVWMAGDFNMAGGVPRDGLAWLHGESASDYQTWSLAALRDLPDQIGPGEDANGDGRPNLFAYATGADPLVPFASGGALQPIPGAPGTFGIWLNPEAADVEFLIEISNDLTNWTPATEHDITLHETEGRLVFQLSPTNEPRFVRVRFRLSLP